MYSNVVGGVLLIANVGGPEFLVIAVIALIALGPEQLPVVMRRIGNAVQQARKATDSLRQEFMGGLDEIQGAANPDTWLNGTGTDDDPVVKRGYVNEVKNLKQIRSTDLPAKTEPRAVEESNEEPTGEEIGDEAEVDTDTDAEVAQELEPIPEPEPGRTGLRNEVALANSSAALAVAAEKRAAEAETQLKAVEEAAATLESSPSTDNDADAKEEDDDDFYDSHFYDDGDLADDDETEPVGSEPVVDAGHNGATS